MQITNRVLAALKWVQAEMIDATGDGRYYGICIDRSERYGDGTNITIEGLDKDGCSITYRVWANGSVTGENGIKLFQN